jgi:hypothetical protein
MEARSAEALRSAMESRAPTDVHRGAMEAKAAGAEAQKNAMEGRGARSEVQRSAMESRDAGSEVQRSAMEARGDARGTPPDAQRGSFDARGARAEAREAARAEGLQVHRDEAGACGVHREAMRHEQADARGDRRSARSDFFEQVAVAMTYDPRAAARQRTTLANASEGAERTHNPDTAAHLAGSGSSEEGARTSQARTREDQAKRSTAEVRHPADRETGTSKSDPAERQLPEAATTVPEDKRKNRTHERAGERSPDTESLRREAAHGTATADREANHDPDLPEGLRETDPYGDAHRCHGILPDGSRCLRHPPEGERYCAEHRIAAAFRDPL